MATNKLLDSPFNYGDIVKVKKDAPECYKPDALGCVCGIRTIDNYETVQKFNLKFNSDLYLIEFKDGQSLEIPKLFLLPYSD